MKIIVTGAAGFFGRQVAKKYVELGHEVIGIDVQPLSAEDEAVGLWQHFTADLTDIGQVMQLVPPCDALVHIAAIPRPLGRAASEVFRINTSITYNVVEAACRANIQRLLYASSFSILGYPFATELVQPDYFPIDEAHRACPQEAYGLSKWVGEEIVQAAVERGEFSALSLRMPWIQSSATFARDIGARRDTDDAARDLWAYLDIRDATDAFVQALNLPITGHKRVFLSAADTYNTIATADLVSRYFPAVPWRLADGQQSIQTDEAKFVSLIDLRPARDLLNFTPQCSWRDYITTNITG